MGIFQASRTLFTVLTCLVLTNTFLAVSAAANITSTSFSKELAEGGNVTVAVNIPTDAGAEQDLFFSFSAPAKEHSWVAFGMGGTDGNHMSNSLIFVMYASDKPGNPTISPRKGTGHTQPLHDKDVNITMLEGSTFNSSTFVANFRCHNCRNWGSGSINSKSDDYPFFSAFGPSSTSFASSNVEENIQAHDLSDTFSFSMTLSQASGPGGVPIAGSSSDNGTDEIDDGDYTYVSGTILIHMLAMIGAFLIVFPGGYLFLRVLNRVPIHWAIQSFGVICVIIGMATGVAASVKQGISPHLTNPHQIIGLIVTGLILVTFSLGLFGHMSFKRTNQKSPLMLGHRVLGPGSILLGLVNACVGFNFAGRPRAIIGFVIVCIAMVLFIGAIVMLKKRAKQRMNAMNSSAAANFREGHGAYPPPPKYQQYGNAPPEYYAPHGTAVPMQTFAPPQGPPPQELPSQDHHRGNVELVNVQPK